VRTRCCTLLLRTACSRACVGFRGNDVPQHRTSWRLMSRRAEPSATPQLSAGAREWLTWARSVPSGACEAARYREPAFEGSRAPPKAATAARELDDARQALTKARRARLPTATALCARGHCCPVHTPAHGLSCFFLHLPSPQAVVRDGDGGASPRDGDEVLLHLSLRSADEEERFISSTRAAEGGRDVPMRAVLGEHCSLLRGVELALAVFTRGERAVLRLSPEFAYGVCASRRRAAPACIGVGARANTAPLMRRLCGFLCVQAMRAAPRAAWRRRAACLPSCQFTARLSCWTSSPSRRASRRTFSHPLRSWGAPPEAHTPRLLCAQVVTDQGGLVTKRILREGNGLETPHSPYEARAHTLLARALSGPVSRRLQSASEAKYGTPACIAPGRLS
jgi:hypothetical protein